jgi:hypothetical protein
MRLRSTFAGRGTSQASSHMAGGSEFSLPFVAIKTIAERSYQEALAAPLNLSSWNSKYLSFPQQLTLRLRICRD